MHSIFSPPSRSDAAGALLLLEKFFEKYSTKKIDDTRHRAILASIHGALCDVNDHAVNFPLNFDYEYVGNAGARLLAEVAQQHQPEALTSISLRGVGLDSAQTHYFEFVGILPTLPSLRHLDLSENPISGNLAELFSGLSKCRELGKISLSSIGADDDICNHLSLFSESSQNSLSSIDISLNNISAKVFDSICLIPFSLISKGLPRLVKFAENIARVTRLDVDGESKIFLFFPSPLNFRKFF